MKAMLSWLYEKYFLTLLIVITLMVLFVVVTLKVFFAPVEIPTGTAATYSTFFAALGLALAHWRWRRSKKDGGEDVDNDPK